MAGPLIKDVVSAITTRATKSRSLRSPASCAMDARMSSIAPRAFIPKPTAVASRHFRPPKRAPSVQPSNFGAVASTTTSTHRRRSKDVTKFARRPSEAKNTGANTFVTNSSITSPTRALTCADRLRVTPAMKPPKRAWRPIPWVAPAEKSAITMTTDKMRAGTALPRRWMRSSTKSRKRLPTTSIAATNMNDSPTVRPNAASLKIEPRTGPRSKTSESQPTMSSIIAADITSSPTSDLKRPRSSSVLAMTGSAEMLSATASRSASISRRDGSTNSESGRSMPRAKPQLAGTTMPSSAVVSALLPRRRKTPTSISRPTMTSSSTTAMVVYALIIVAASPEGKSHA